MPVINARQINHQNGVSGFWTAKNQPIMGMTKSNEEMPTSFRVPRIGGKNMYSRRNNPPESPGTAANQYNCSFERLKPMALSFGAMAATRYHTQKPMVREMVEIIRVRHATLESHRAGSSGSQPCNTRPSVLREVMKVSPFVCIHDGAADECESARGSCSS